MASICPVLLKTYAEVLMQYHLNAKDEFAPGQFLDRGRPERHVVATGFAWIGREANRAGESVGIGPHSVGGRRSLRNLRVSQ